MGDITSTSTIIEALPNSGVKVFSIETVATADTADTIEITLADYGVSTFLGIQGFIHTTEGSVVVAEAPTTAVSSGVLTITIGGSTVSDKKRVFIIYGK